MNSNTFSPYIRVASFSTIIAPFTINERVIFDYEIIFVDGGKSKLTIDNKEYMLKKNDVVFLRPGIPHKFESIKDYDFIQPHIHFDILYNEKSEETPVSFKPREKMTNYELSLIQKNLFAGREIPYVFTPRDKESFKKQLLDIITIFQEKPPFYELLYKSKLLIMLHSILTQFSFSEFTLQSTEFEVIDIIKNFIDNNYLSIITLTSLSSQFCMNKYTMLRKFKAKYGYNTMAYYRMLRLEHAKKALLQTRLPISSIAEELNFLDVYSFSRFFKQCTGKSPQNYRKDQ